MQIKVRYIRYTIVGVFFINSKQSDDYLWRYLHPLKSAPYLAMIKDPKKFLDSDCDPDHH